MAKRDGIERNRVVTMPESLQTKATKIPLAFTQTVDLRFHSCDRTGINNKFSKSFLYLLTVLAPRLTVPRGDTTRERSPHPKQYTYTYIYFAKQSRIQTMFSHYLFEMRIFYYENSLGVAFAITIQNGDKETKYDRCSLLLNALSFET